jgi:glycosyltransferase involved in cell wall biosynthesis
LFVAGLEAGGNGVTGGQVTEAGTLFTSRLGELMELVPLGSTMRSVPPPPLVIRLWDSGSRLVRFGWELRRADAVLIYPASGLSLIEKGAMALLARVFSRGVVVRLTAGNLLSGCRAHPLLDRWLRLVMKAAHVLPTQGQSWTQWFSAYPEANGKLLEIYNGLALAPATTSRKAGCPPVITYIGWMVEEKGIFDALKVFKRVRVQYPDVQFVVAGGGTKLEEFAAAVRRERLDSSVHLLGWIPKERVFPLLAESDVFLFASHSEGMPNAVLEAMAAGLPVVTTRVGALPDIISHGENAFLADVNDVDALTESVLQVLGDKDLAIQVGKNARRTIEEHFDIERIWPKYAEILIWAAMQAGRATTSPGDISASISQLK